jgi:5'-nucleotidase
MNAHTLTPCFWQTGSLVPSRTLPPLDEAAQGRVTILHTNDLHASIDARSRLGGLARITSTIDAARAAGPTLVVDSGDSVFGGGTWWCARDAGATSRLMSLAGYDLATIGNHDLEHGADSVRELLAGGRRLVSTNLEFDAPDLREQIAPAYVVETSGLRIGVLGATTLMTLDLVPSSFLHGVRYLATNPAIARAVAALSPLVHTIVILSHLGFANADDSDIHLIPVLKGSKVSVVLGGHTHEAHDPAYVINGMLVCNAGAHGINVNQVNLARDGHGSIVVQAKLVPQDESVIESERFLHARAEELAAFAPLQATHATLPPLPPSDSDKRREVALLAAALRARGMTGVQMIPFLYIVDELPEVDSVTQLEVLTTFPNAEPLVIAQVPGGLLRSLIEFQQTLRMVYSAAAVWIDSGLDVATTDLHDEHS